MKKILATLLTLILLSSCDKEKNNLRDGNDLFEKKEFSKAEDSYRKALNEDSTYTKAQYNLANTLYKEQKQEDYTKAIMYYDKALSQDTVEDKELLSNIFYNRANANFGLALSDSTTKQETYSKGLQDAVQDYKKALRLMPSDSAAKHNLALAMHLLKQNQQQQQQQQNQDKNQDQDKKEEEKKEEEEKKDQKDDKQEEDKKEENQDQQQQPQDKEEDKQKQEPKDMQEEERMLEALKNNEKRTLEKLNKKKDKEGNHNHSGKDW